MNFRTALALAVIITPLIGCQAVPQTNVMTNLRLCIMTPDGQIHTLADEKCARWAEARHRSGDGSTPFQGIVLSDRQITRVIQIITENQTVRWAAMTAKTPYPRSEITVLIYRPQDGGLMCNVGTGDRAVRVLEQIIACIPKEHRAELQKSMEAIRTTQPPAGGDGKPAPQP